MSVVCMGEMIVDMIQENNDKTFKAYPGGAPANVAVGIARLGGKPLFMGKVGEDAFGDTLEDILLREKVNTEGMKKGGCTGMAFVTLDKNGERSFEFKGDLINFGIEDIEFKVIDESKIFHFGSISLIKDPSRMATEYCLEYAKKRNIMVSYDPNLRLNLWPNEQLALDGIKKGLKYADILKVSDEELDFITSESSIDKGIKKLIKDYPNLKLIAVTLGKDGTACYYKNECRTIPTIKVNVVDTTGAGDGFMSGLLFKLSQVEDVNNMDWDQLERIIEYANIVGSLTTTKKGAISAMPIADEVDAILKKHFGDSSGLF